MQKYEESVGEEKEEEKEGENRRVMTFFPQHFWHFDNLNEFYFNKFLFLISDAITFVIADLFPFNVQIFHSQTDINQLNFNQRLETAFLMSLKLKNYFLNKIWNPKENVATGTVPSDLIRQGFH